MNKKIYAKNIIEFATVAHEYCVLMENIDKYSKADFIKVSSRLLPLLYIKASLLPEDVATILDTDLEEAVDEFTYETVRKAIRRKLTRHDEYLEVFKEDMERSEEPVPANISEDMADIYQDIMNFCEQYRLGIEDVQNDAIATVSEKFRTYWGQRLCNALRALHCVLYSGDDLSDEKAAEESYADSLPTWAQELLGGTDDED
ncbi:MAG: DUF5063 domain-containing protein [Bacteroidales bacterium]|nr:DUF5063 domain-containing protein [Bacteroidales bacterium]